MHPLSDIAAFCVLFTATMAEAEIVVRIDKSAQRMHVSVNGEQRHHFVVSTGLAGGPPRGAYRPQRMERVWHSRLYNWAPMPHAIFFHGNYAIHGTNQVRRLGQRASKGCVRLHPGNAATLFSLVKQHGMANTRIIVEARTRRVDRQSEPPARQQTVTRAVTKTAGITAQ